MSNSTLDTMIFAHEALFSLASAIGTPLQVDKATTGVIKEVLQKIVYDKLPSYCTTCKHQGHKEEECRLTMEIEGGLIDETKINGEKFEGDFVDNLNKEKYATTTSQERVNAPGLLLLTATSGHKEDTEAMLVGMLTSKISEQLGAAATGSSTPVHIDVEAQNNADNNSRELIVTSQVATRQLLSRFMNDGELGSPNAVVVTKSRQDEAKQGTSTAENPFDVSRDGNFGQYEGLHGTAELSAESGNTLDLEKQIKQTGKLKERCHDDHTDQQALVTHEKESIVTEEIDGKEINPNTPAMFISNQEMATTDLNEAKEKQGETSASRWEDLVEAENHTPTPSRSKLSTQICAFKDILPDLGSDMSDGDDEDDMLDICFDKVTKDGDLSPRQQRSGSTKCKKKTYGRQHSWDGKVSEEFVPKHLPMRLAKQNHMTVSTTLSRSNKSNKK
ncbi:hypothetical protein KY285_037954 [Solanum tuberosum]|nr:hypothetical protein KY285_037954 [Solanum tuberosum]